MVLLVFPGTDTSATKEVRDLANSPEAAKYTKAQAIVVDNLAHRIMANFIMKFYKAGIIVRVFSERKKAEDWLQQFLIK